MSDTPTDDDNGPADPRQVILPPVDAGMKIRDASASSLWYALPGGLVAAGGVTSLILGDVSTSIPLISAGSLTGGAGFVFAERSDDNTTGLDRMRAPIRARRQKQHLPRDHTDLLDDPIHGVRRVSSDGFVEMDDGRLVAFVRLKGRNSDLETDEERQRTANTITSLADERIGDYNFRYYSTTRQVDPGAYPEKLRDAATDHQTVDQGWYTARQLLAHTANWYEDDDSRQWGDAHWCHYAVVEVAPWEITTRHADDEDSGRFGFLDQLTGEDSDDSSPTDRERLVASMQRELRKRVATLTGGVFGTVTGVEAYQAGGTEVAGVLSEFWTGTDTTVEVEDEDLEEKRLSQSLSAPNYTFGDEYVEIGRQYARTYWVSGWPSQPDASFLRELVTMRGVDVDVTVRFGSVDQEDAKFDIKNNAADLDAELDDQEEKSDLAAIAGEADMDDYLRAYLLLHANQIRAWRLNAYVTVRAGDRAALDSAEVALRDGLESESSVSLDVERARALEDRSDEVTGTAEEEPADLSLVSPGSRQQDLFRSASPVGRDVYRDVSHKDRERYCLGGAIGALFPATATIYDDIEDGIAWGRNRQNGTEIIADPFNVGGPGHGLFIGDSGSGKTYSVVLRALRWWIAKPDRTLVLAGPFGDLSGIVNAFAGDQLVIGGSQTINPLAISPESEQARKEGVDAVNNKVNEAVAFLSGVLREAGVDPGDYTTMMETAAYETYEHAGIYKDDPESQRRESPTMRDYRKTLRRLANNPDQESFSESDYEIEDIEKTAAELIRKLSGFQDGRRYEHFTGKNEFSIDEGGMSYIDLRNLESLGKVGKSAALQIVLSRVYETVKETDGETLFLLDEAHYLMHNEDTLEWIQRATRHWRHHDGGIWLSSQRPDEFVNMDPSGTNHHETIRSQCTIKQITNCDGIDKDVAGRFGLNSRQYDFADEDATRGDDWEDSPVQGYSDALLSFKDMDGWVRTRVKASPMEHSMLIHDPDDDPSMGEYLAERHGLDAEMIDA